MTSALVQTPSVSAFYDVDNLLYQNRKNAMKMQQMNVNTVSADRRILGASTTNIRNRNLSTGSFSSGNRPATAANVVSLISKQDFVNQSVASREHRKLDRSFSEPAPTNRDANANTQRNINSTRYKTELCRPFEESGNCRYGDKCQFAHGAHELRNVSRHPKYKTELCRTYHTVGFCPYGPRCHFIHNEEERNRIMAENQRALAAGQAMPDFESHFPPPMGTQPERPKSISVNGFGSTPSSSVSGDSPTMSPTFLNEDIYPSLSTFSPSTGVSTSSSSSPVFSQVGSSNSSSPVFNFSSDDYNSVIASLVSPLQVQTQHAQLNTQDMNALQHQFNIFLNFNQRNIMNNNITNTTAVFSDQYRENFETFTYAPPSPPDSISGDSVGSVSSTSSGSTGCYEKCGSPLDVGKSWRLPIFNSLHGAQDL